MHPAIRDYDLAWEGYAREGVKAWLLAPDIPTYLALMRGETVPVERLCPDAVRAYGLKQ